MTQPTPPHDEAATVGPRCGNNPHAQLTDGDRKAITEFKAHLADRNLRDRIAVALADAGGREYAPGMSKETQRHYDRLAAAVLAVLPAAADRASVLREAADLVGNDDDCDCGGCDTCIPNKLAAELRRMADEAQPGAAPAAATPCSATVRPVRYEVSVLPENNINYPVYAIAVEYRGGSRWAVVRHGSCLGADGTWEFGVKPYDRDDAWLNAHRFDLETALRLAEETAPDVVVNGVRAADVAARAAEGSDR
ncbi:hypothetical protein AB0H03_06605 [Streptomyces sparsogenes]|uniref:hypothetical protein n=1 Tax=Streptomyces sparsogenes TaxID=67365 RepID=UPI0033DF471B